MFIQSIKTYFSLLVIAGVFITGCNNQNNESGSRTKAKMGMSVDITSNKEELIKQAPGIMGSWENTQFGDFKALVPTGKDWKKVDDHTFENSVHGCTIVLQVQSGDFTNNMDEYLISYNDVNKKDAPKYELISQKKGFVQDIKAACVIGTFDNGEKMVTRDYLLFTRNGVSILQGRIKARNKEYLDDMIDYIAAHIHY